MSKIPKQAFTVPPPLIEKICYALFFPSARSPSNIYFLNKNSYIAMPTTTASAPLLLLLLKSLVRTEPNPSVTNWEVRDAVEGGRSASCPLRPYEEHKARHAPKHRWRNKRREPRIWERRDSRRGSRNGRTSRLWTIGGSGAVNRSDVGRR